MSEKEKQEFAALLQEYSTKFSGKKKASKEFLIAAGILTKKGNLKERFKNLPLCMPQEPA